MCSAGNTMVVKLVSQEIYDPKLDGALQKPLTDDELKELYGQKLIDQYGMSTMRAYNGGACIHIPELAAKGEVGFGMEPIKEGSQGGELPQDLLAALNEGTYESNHRNIASGTDGLGEFRSNVKNNFSLS